MNDQNKKGYTGLANLGNTCFLNSCIQVLKHTNEINNILDSKKIKKFIKNDSYDSLILNEWNDLRNIMINNNGIVSPNRFINNVHKVAKHKDKDIFTGWSQNDMPEFLLFMIECFHNSISRKINIKISGKTMNNTDELAVKCYTMLKETYSKEYSEFMDIFYGIYVSTLISIDQKVTYAINPESFFVLDLSIPDKSDTSLYDCFDLFVNSEYLTGENSWYNEKTKNKEDVKKQITFWSFPKILVITLKRFSYDGRSKIDKLIDFPIDNLDLSKYVSGYKPSTYVYELFGVCNHIGNIFMGHYTSFVKDSDEWIHYNDSSIEFVKNKELVVTPMAYCLFYRKKNN